MPIHYSITFPCALKDDVGGEPGLASQLRLYSAVQQVQETTDDASGNGGDATVRWLRHATGRPQTLTLPAAREQLADLDELAARHCAGCEANRYGSTDAPTGTLSRPRGVGCHGVIPLPISAAAEDYLADLLGAALDESLGGSHNLRLLLVEQLRAMPGRGLASAALRQSERGPEFFERRKARQVSRGRWLRKVKLSTDQVFERSILERKLPDGMCLFLAAFSGGIRVQPVPPDGDVRDLQPEEGVPWTLIHPDNPTRPDVLWTFEMPDPPAGTESDPSVQGFRRFFTACFHAWTLKCDLALEAAVIPPDAGE